jgi:hypothetical protein
VFEEWDQDIERYTGKNTEKRVTSILRFRELSLELKNILGLNPSMGGIEDLVALALDDV